jgi:hypothetical protein
MRKVIAGLLVILFAFQTSIFVTGEETEQIIEECLLNFDGLNANQSVHFQTDLGPRLPGSLASASLRESIKSNLTGWHITESTHHSNGMTLTNLYATWNRGEGSTVMFAAHYDSRHKAERDWNESRRDQPIDGANDGASGVAVLLELARIIPTMNLSHEITLFFTDGEDQGDNHSTYVLGAKAWAENLSQQDADQIESFVLVDMVGDSDLTLRKTSPGNSELWNRTEQIIRNIDEVCELNDSSYFDFERVDGIYDDHVPAHNLGIPAIDIIDTRYGEGAKYLEGHWHTHNDTIDKVSAESLQTVGFILEYGLISGSWLNIRMQTVESNDTDLDGIIDSEDHCPLESGEEPNGCVDTDSDTGIASQEIDDLTTGVTLALCLIIICSILIWNIYADNQGEG